MRISFRFTLLTVVPAFVLIASGFAVYATFASVFALIGGQTERLFADAAENAVEGTDVHISQATATLAVLQSIPKETLARALDDEAAARSLARTMSAILQSGQHFSWVSYSYADGSFFGVTRRGKDEIVLNRSRVTAKGSPMSEHRVEPDGKLTHLRSEEDNGYDARERPFFKEAVAKRGRIWTVPYVFYEEGLPGITAAEPDVVEGALRGVFTVDFNLTSLAALARTIKVSPSGSLFIVSSGERLIAHPRIELVARQGDREQGTLVTLGDVRDAPLQAFAAILRARGGVAEAAREESVASSHFRFDVAGVAYLGTLRRFIVDRRIEMVVGVLAPESDFVGDVREQSQRAAALAVGLTLVSVVLAFFLARRVASPLHRIAYEMNLASKLYVVDGNQRRSLFIEIDEIEAALQNLKAGLRSFSRFVPGDVVRSLLEAREEARPDASLKRVTVSFSDVAGFTQMAEATAPQELTETLSGYFETLTAIIAQRRGTIDKFIGDAVMALYNVPEAVEHHEAMACLAALDARDRIAAMRASKDAGVRRFALPTRFGIATGDAVVGTIGTPARLNYTALGDVVNLAARLEPLNKVYGTQILISEPVFEAAQSSIVARIVDVVAVTGKREAVAIYELLCTATAADAEMHREVARRSEAAFRLYLVRDFENAMGFYREVLALVPDDPVATLMMARCEAYLDAPPPLDWRGVWVVPSKNPKASGPA